MNFWSAGYSILQNGVEFARSASPATKKSVEEINMEGFTSAMRIAMFPYAPDAKISLEEFAINFDLPYEISGLNAKSVTRYLNGQGRKDFILVKQVARIMLDLFPPVPVENQKETNPTVEIYQGIIAGLEFIQKKFFAEQPFTNKIPNPQTFGSESKSQKHTEITEFMAGEAIFKAINLFKHCLVNKIEPKNNLSLLQVKVKEGYTPSMIFQFANGLRILKKVQGNIPVTAEWVAQDEFFSLDYLIRGRIRHYQRLLPNMSTLVPTRSETDLFDSKPLEMMHASLERSLDKNVDNHQNDDWETVNEPASVYNGSAIIQDDYVPDEQ